MADNNNSIPPGNYPNPFGTPNNTPSTPNAGPVPQNTYIPPRPSMTQSVTPTPTIAATRNIPGVGMVKAEVNWFFKFRKFFKLFQIVAVATTVLAFFIQLIAGRDFGITIVVFGVGELIATTLYFGLGTIAHTLLDDEEAPLPLKAGATKKPSLFGTKKK